jgi:hypothetical protein
VLFCLPPEASHGGNPEDRGDLVADIVGYSRLAGADEDRTLSNGSYRPVPVRKECVEILWGESRRLIGFGFGTVTGERPMLQENEGTISTRD